MRKVFVIAQRVAKYFGYSCKKNLLPRIFKNRDIFFRNGPTPASFLFIFVLLLKNCRRQQDSNSDCRSRRRARLPLDHHRHHLIYKHFYTFYSFLDALFGLIIFGFDLYDPSASFKTEDKRLLSLGISVTRWLDNFSIFVRLRQWKLAT